VVNLSVGLRLDVGDFFGADFIVVEELEDPEERDLDVWLVFCCSGFLRKKMVILRRAHRSLLCYFFQPSLPFSSLRYLMLDTLRGTIVRVSLKLVLPTCRIYVRVRGNLKRLRNSEDNAESYDSLSPRSATYVFHPASEDISKETIP
jgi:hypothetical protein